MIKSHTEKNLAIATSLSILLAMAATSKVQATTMFPPTHTDATFSESQQASNTIVAGSYYRPNTEQTLEVQIRASGVDLAYSDVRITPYYRSAN